MRNLLSLLLASPAAASFSLDTTVKDYWYYVHNHLDAGTSEACLAAYNAPLDCDQTLLGMVSSGSPNFNPGPDDLKTMCTPTCKDSLDAYVKNVKKVCTGPHDGAIVSENVSPKPVIPVHMVGEVFRYKYAWGCSTNSTGYCYFNYGYARDPAYAKSDFPCENKCATQFMETAHDYPGSNYSFRVYELEYQSDWWENVYKQGWDTVLQCRKDGHGSDDSSETDTETETATATETSASSTQTSDVDDDGDKETVTATHEVSVTVTAGSSATASSTGVPANGAGRQNGGNTGVLFVYLAVLMLGVAWI